jgi:phosphopantetheine--protein transferase-like protein
MEDKIKGLIATYLRVPAEQISYSTIVDRTAVSSSIALHRMYAKLAEEGFTVPDYWNIKTFSSLIERINGNGHTNTATEFQQVQANNIVLSAQEYAQGPAIGIDIEDVNAMPKTNDFREDEFYKMNFSQAEIAYCILQPAPYASFAGLFATKEAIVKAINTYRNKPFNTININHDDQGKPLFPGFSISLSHTDNMAVAVAVQMVTDHQHYNNSKEENTVLQPVKSNGKWLFVLSFIVSVVALIIALFK